MAVEGKVWSGVAVLFASCPCGVNAYLFAERYKAGASLASSSIAISTSLSIVSIVFWLWMLGVHLNCRSREPRGGGDPVERPQDDAGEQPPADESQHGESRDRPPGVLDEHLEEVGAVRGPPPARL